MNEEFRYKDKEIGDLSPVRYLGYFPAASLLHKLQVKDDISLLQSMGDFDYSLYDCMEALMMACLVSPEDSGESMEQIMPSDYGYRQFSGDQIQSFCDFADREYEKFAEIFVRHLAWPEGFHDICAKKNGFHAFPSGMHTGQALIWHISELLERLVQYKVLENRFTAIQVYDFFRSFQVIGSPEGVYTNLTPRTPVLEFIQHKYALPVLPFYLSQKNIQKILEADL